MTTIKYKDYQGSVDYEDGKLVLQILHIDDTIIGECDSAQKAQKSFADLVDDYLETCREIGKSPSKPFKGSFNVRVSPTLHKAAAYAASECGETLNGWVERSISRSVEAHGIQKSMAIRVLEDLPEQFRSEEEWEDLGDESEEADHVPHQRSTFVSLVGDARRSEKFDA